MSEKTDLKVGWYRKGKTLRYLYAAEFPMLIYKTKSAFERNSKKSQAVNAFFDKWFFEAQYIGPKLEAETE